MANLNKPGSGKDLVKQVQAHPSIKAALKKQEQKLAEFRAKQANQNKNNA